MGRGFQRGPVLSRLVAGLDGMRVAHLDQSGSVSTTSVTALTTTAVIAVSGMTRAAQGPGICQLVMGERHSAQRASVHRHRVGTWLILGLW